jgi:hypothetical protein
LASPSRINASRRRAGEECNVGHAIKVSPWLALRAAVLRLAVSPWALPGTAAWVCGFVVRLTQSPARAKVLVVCHLLWPCQARCPTLPSRGRHKGYALAPPLMSNVGHHESPEVFSLPPSLHPSPQAQPVAAAVYAVFVAVASPSRGAPRGGRRVHQCSVIQHRGITPQKRRQVLACRQSQSVVGAPRRSAAPGSRSLGAAEYGSLGPKRCREAGVIAGKKCRPYRLASSVAHQSAMPNPSIERTRPGKPGRASHVKR